MAGDSRLGSRVAGILGCGCRNRGCCDRERSGVLAREGRMAAAGSWQAGTEPGPGGLAAWAERSGRRRAEGAGRGGLRFAFYGRVSTEGWQDPESSLARQLAQAEALVCGHGAVFSSAELAVSVAMHPGRHTERRDPRPPAYSPSPDRAAVGTRNAPSVPLPVQTQKSHSVTVILWVITDRIGLIPFLLFHTIIRPQVRSVQLTWPGQVGSI